MRAFLSVLTVCIPLVLVACDSSDNGGSAAVRYDLVLSEAGATAATGSLTFATAPVPGANVGGQYSLTAAGGGPLEPLMTTSGSFTGDFEGDSLIVRILPPGTSDVGLRLAGTVSSTTYAGTWSEVTIAGPQVRGTFVGNAD